MSKSKHREAQMIGALKQVEAGRKVEDVAPESVSGKPRPVQENQGQMNKCGTALGGKILSKLTIQRGETRAVSRPGLNQIDEPILLFPRRPPDSSEWRRWARLNCSHCLLEGLPSLGLPSGIAKTRLFQ